MDLRSELSNFTGTTCYYSSSFGTLKLTEGIHYLREKANCFWLVDIVESYQPTLKEVCFQIWKITVNEDQTAVVTCREDDGLPELVKQDIPYTDFPLSDFEFFCINNVVLLKSEY